MMFKVAFIFALLAFSAIATSPVASVPTTQTGENDITQCLNDITQLVSIIPEFVNDLQSGDFSKIVADLTKLVTLIQQTVTDCASSEETLRANAISAKCFQDISDSLPVIEKTLNDINTGDFSAVLSDVLKLVSSFQKIIKDCQPVTLPEFKRNDVTQCLNDITQVVSIIPEFINDLQSGDFSKIVADLTKLVTFIQQTVTDCVSHQDNLHHHGISPQCIQDLSSALPVIEKTISDIASSDIAAVLTDVVQLVSLFQKIVSDCTASTTFPHVYLKSALRH